MKRTAKETFLYNFVKIYAKYLTLFLPAKGGISPYMSVTWPSPVGIGLSYNLMRKLLKKSEKLSNIYLFQKENLIQILLVSTWPKRPFRLNQAVMNSRSGGAGLGPTYPVLRYLLSPWTMLIIRHNIYISTVSSKGQPNSEWISPNMQIWNYKNFCPTNKQGSYPKTSLHSPKNHQEKLL